MRTYIGSPPALPAGGTRLPVVFGTSQYQRAQTFPAPHTAHLRTWRLVVLATHTPLILVLPGPQAARISMTELSGCAIGATGIACAEELTASAIAKIASLFIDALPSW